MNPEQQLSSQKPPRRSPEEIAQLIAAFRSSGLSQREFCQRQGISRHTFQHHWQKRRGREEGERGRGQQLLAVQVVGRGGRKEKQEGGEDAGLVVVLGRGRRIEVGLGFDEATLEQVVAVLERE